MADISRLLNEATGKAEQVRKRIEEERKQEPQSPAEDASRLQAMVNWKQSTITQEMFASIGKQHKQYIDLALETAGQCTTEVERIVIINLLIKAKALKEVIQTYTK